MNPPDCPKFNTCNASLCPLGQNPSERGRHIAGESVCFYLTGVYKAGAAEKFKDDPVFAECLRQVADIVQEYPSIGKRLEQASKTPFRTGFRKRLEPTLSGTDAEDVLCPT